MQTIVIVIVYKLREGVKLEDYIEWSKKEDQPAIKNVEYIIDYAPYYVLGPEKIWNVFEIITVNKWEDWERFSKSETCKNLTKQWLEYADKNSVKTVYGNRIEF